MFGDANYELIRDHYTPSRRLGLKLEFLQIKHLNRLTEKLGVLLRRHLRLHRLLLSFL